MNKIIVRSTFAILGAVVVWFILASVIWGFGVATAGIYGRGEAQKKIQSADFRIEAYQRFFNQYASIKSLEGRIDELTNQLNQLEKGTREYNYTLSSLVGVKDLGMRQYKSIMLMLKKAILKDNLETRVYHTK